MLARGGDEQAKDRLFEACRRYVSMLARTQVHDWMQAKIDNSDVVQQTMLEAHRGFDRFRGGSTGEWLAWLKQVLTHNAADLARRYGGTAKRKASRERSIDGEDQNGIMNIADQVPSPSACVEQHERELMVADALERLSPDHRTVIYLRNLQQLPFEEVAEKMGRSRPAAQMLWMRALERLKVLLADPNLEQDEG